MRKIRNLLWRLAQRVLLVLVGIIGALLLTEIGLRLFFARQLEMDVKRTAVDAYLGWRNLPG